MSISFETVCQAFRQQSVGFVDLVDATPDLAASTPLDGWDCAVLVGHVSTAVEALWRWAGDPPNGAPELDRVTWWDAADPAVNASFAQRYASKRTHDELRELITGCVVEANERLSEAAPDSTLVAPGGVAWARFDEALATRVFELTVHGLDLAAATDSATVPGTAALAVASEILDRRLDGDRPPGLESDLDWVRAGTGRTSNVDSRLPVVR